jgi:predicted nucleic acid-binding protein
MHRKSYQGARNKRELLHYSAFLETFGIISASALDQKEALTIFKSVYLLTGVSFNDALNAAISINNNATLYTLNEKHFRVIFGLSYTIL